MIELERQIYVWNKHVVERETPPCFDTLHWRFLPCKNMTYVSLAFKFEGKKTFSCFYHLYSLLAQLSEKSKNWPTYRILVVRFLTETRKLIGERAGEKDTKLKAADIKTLTKFKIYLNSPNMAFTVIFSPNVTFEILFVQVNGWSRRGF